MVDLLAKFDTLDNSAIIGVWQDIIDQAQTSHSEVFWPQSEENLHYRQQLVLT